MNLIIWLLIGALVGWLASMVMKTDARQGALLNIVVGIVGAVVLLAIVNLVTRGRVR